MEALAIVGTCFLAYCSLKLVWSLLNGARAFLLPLLGFRRNLKRFGPWAVVTGCTDGIGKAFAHQLAHQGLDLVLISRSSDKLEALADMIRTKFGVSTKVIVFDFSGGAETYDALERKFAGMDIGILVNNVGMSHHAHYFPEITLEVCSKMINTNVLSMTMLTRMILPGMKSRRRGLVINISSAAGFAPVVLSSVYSGTKAFVDFFSRCLHEESAAQGVLVQSVLPYYVATKMSRIRETSLFVPGPEEYVRQTLGTVGVESRTNGYWTHALECWLAGLIPEWIYFRLTWNIQTKRRQVFDSLNRKAKEMKTVHTD